MTSALADQAGSDAIFSLQREAGARRQAGERIIDGTVGVLLADDGELLVLPTFKRVLAALPAQAWMPYAPAEGEATFLEAVCRDVLPAELRASAIAVATPGATGAIRQAIATCLVAGEALLTTSHYFTAYRDIAAEQQRRLVTFNMLGPGGGLDVAGLDAALGTLAARQRRVLLLLNDPCQNPTGYTMSASDWEAVAEIVSAHARRTSLTLLLDVAYADFGAAGWCLPYGALARLEGLADVLVAWSASKSFTAYGLRVGALLAIAAAADRRRALAAALARACRGTWGNGNRGGMLAVAEVLSNPVLARDVARERRALVALLARRRHVFEAAARRRHLPEVVGSSGFFTAILARPAARAAALMRARGVFVVPQGEVVRIALCAVPTSELPTLVDVVADCLTELKVETETETGAAS